MVSLLGSDDFNICAKVPHLWSVLAVPPERQNIRTCFQRLWDLHTVLPKPFSIACSRNIDFGPLGAIDICGPDCSFLNKISSSCTVSNPSVRSIEVQMSVLKALLGDPRDSGRGHFAEAVCISTSVPGARLPQNFCSLATFPFCNSSIVKEPVIGMLHCRLAVGEPSTPIFRLCTTGTIWPFFVPVTKIDRSFLFALASVWISPAGTATLSKRRGSPRRCPWVFQSLQSLYFCVACCVVHVVGYGWFA